LLDLEALQARILHQPRPTVLGVPQIYIAPLVADALAQARALVGPVGVVCVTGSLFVAAAAREVLGLAEERDPPKI
jgi:hypothetical protein